MNNVLVLDDELVFFTMVKYSMLDEKGARGEFRESKAAFQGIF